MADNLTPYTEKKFLEHLTGRTEWTKPAFTYLALYTVAPTEVSAGTEVPTSGTNYVRIKLTWGAASEAEGSISTSALAKFPAAGTASTAWGTIVALGVTDAASSGNLLTYGPLTTTFVMELGDTFTVISGGITLTAS